ncbi:autotransporter domain-containing protein [Pseudomonas gingeri]|uniref:autotransporter domain-containing protein n=1 Tax=Pseudomonas gingeri TaxID=117681 RepID=UPI0015A4B598|nr:autotransporter domain-containing protein [Pseudomonas gingeri]
MAQAGNGAPGRDGAQGPQGVRGPQGIPGPIGQQGSPGRDGGQGPQGERGPQGIPGPIGHQGPPGQDGVQGIAGPVGPQGEPGRDGVQGIPGPIGPQGEPGRDGVQGIPGPIGPQGEPGRDGVQGIAGPIGPPGRDGAEVNAATIKKIDRNEQQIAELRAQLDTASAELATQLADLGKNPEQEERIAKLENNIANLQAQATQRPQADDPNVGLGGQGGNTKPPVPKPVESPLLAALGKLGPAAKRDAWTQLSGAGNANLSRATLSGAGLVGNSALSAMRQLSNDSTQRQLAAQNGAPGQVSLAGRADIKPGESRLWIQALNNASTFDQPQGQSGFEQNTRGLVMGVDWALDSEWRMGLLGGKSQSKHKGSRFDGDLDSWHIGTYALHQSGPVALRLGAIHSQHYGKTQRNVEFSGYKDRLTGDYGANSQQAFAELGYNLGSGSLSAEPFANLGYQRYSRKGYTEKGGEAALKADAQTQDNFSTTLGLRTASIKYMDNKMSLAPRLSAGWKHLYGAIDSTSTQTHQVSGRTFNTKGIAQDRDSLVVEAGLDLNLSARHSVGVAYNGEVGNNSRTHGLMGQWKMSF